MLKDIPGLLLDTGYTGVREPLSFSEIPFLYEEQRLSGKGLQDFQNKIIYYESSRGCPFRCSYCLSSVDKTLRLRDVNRVLPELQFFLDCKVPQVKFIDRTFNCNRAHAKMCIRDRNNPLQKDSIHISCHPRRRARAPRGYSVHRGR